MKSITAVIVAGGKGTRMKAGINKVFLKLLEKEIILHTISAFDNNRLISDIVLVTDDIEKCRNLIAEEDFSKPITVVSGGATRQQSVYNGIQKADGEFVAIHDGARALITDDEITAVINDCIKYGCAALGVKCKDTLKSADEDGFICATIDRNVTYNIQTPQVFNKEMILVAHMKAREDGFEATDDCAVVEHFGGRIKITEGSYENIKITTPEDMAVAENILQKRGLA